MNEEVDGEMKRRHQDWTEWGKRRALQHAISRTIAEKSTANMLRMLNISVDDLLRDGIPVSSRSMRIPMKVIE